MRTGQRQRGALVAAAAALAGVLGMASLAWACVVTEGAYVSDPDPRMAPAGSEVKMSGGGWGAGEQLEIGWSSDGKQVTHQLATTVVGGGGTFEVEVVIPQAQPDMYYLVVSQGSFARAAAFEVTPAGSYEQGRSDQPSSSPSGSGNGSTTVQRQPSNSPQPSPSNGSDTPEASNGSSPTPSGSRVTGGFSPAPAPQAGPANSGEAVPGAERAGGTGPSTAAVGARVPSATSSPLAGRTGAPALAATAASPPGAIGVAGDERVEGTPAARSLSAFGDAWPGFEEGSRFTPFVPSTDPAQGVPSGAAVYVLGLTVALMAVSSGFGLAEAGRRRSLVRRAAQ